jgi:hypothetical protein
MHSFDQAPRKRWPRSQRFQLSARGTAAEKSYRETIIAARVANGRSAYDEARAAWSAPLTLQPNDGLFLGELQSGPRTIKQIVEAVEECGATRAEVHSAVYRLADAGMVEAIAPPSPDPPQLPPRRW